MLFNVSRALNGCFFARLLPHSLTLTLLRSLTRSLGHSFACLIGLFGRVLICFTPHLGLSFSSSLSPSRSHAHLSEKFVCSSILALRLFASASNSIAKQSIALNILHDINKIHFNCGSHRFENAFQSTY